MFPLSNEALPRFGIRFNTSSSEYRFITTRYAVVCSNYNYIDDDDDSFIHLIPPELTRDSLTSSWDSLFQKILTKFSQIRIWILTDNLYVSQPPKHVSEHEFMFLVTCMPTPLRQ